jgi:hypothetical protein
MYSHQMGLDLVAANEIYQELIKNIPQHTSVEWVNQRRKHISNNMKYHDNLKYQDQKTSSATYMQFENRVESSERFRTRNSYDQGKQNLQKKCELTVAIATTMPENISVFKNYVEKFPTTDIVCQVIIVDDGSSPESRLQMMSEYPQFTFVFKSNQEYGLSNTLNTMVQLSKSQYLLYSSDAWEPIAHDDHHLKQALAIMKNHPEKKMAQVILNDQSTISCSLGLNISTCNKMGGWKRVLTGIDGHGNIEYNENE